jgi:hypothetical protein
MATPTYIPLATVTLVTSADYVTFESISQDYSDLVLTIEAKNATDNGSPIFLTFNSDSGASYSRVIMQGNGSSAVSIAQSGIAYAIVGVTTTATPAASQIQIMDYSANDKHKSVLTRFDAATLTQAEAQRWANNSAITSINLVTSPGSFAAGSIFNLFGIHGEVV